MRGGGIVRGTGLVGAEVAGTGIVGVWESGVDISITVGPGVTGVVGSGSESLAVRRNLV